MSVGDEPTSTAGRDYGDTLWTPSAEVTQRAEITRFMSWLAARGGPEADSYAGLWQWSVAEPAAFWSSIWDFFGVLGDKGTGPVLAGQMPSARWFEGGTLNYAGNALRMAPPLTLTQDEAREGLGLLTDALRAVNAGAGA